MNARILVTILFCFVVGGCTSTNNNQADATPILLNDSLFPSFSLFPVEPPEEIFYLDEDAQQFAEKAVLEKSICLVLSIMTLALAEHVGLTATFYEVDIPEYWTRREGFSLLNGHINLRISLPNESPVASVGGTWADVDFDPQMLRNYFPRKAVSRDKVIAMFYNNKGADALVANSYTRAYSYFRAAAKISPALQQTWVNLGVLYRMVDEYEQAELAYKHALALDDENLTAWENLSILYTYQNKDDAALKITQMVEAKRKNNPFYHYILGEQAFEAGKADVAITHYERGLRLDNARHELLFGMAKAFHELGDVSKATRYLKHAVKHSPNEQEKQRYSSKLASLASR